MPHFEEVRRIDDVRCKQMTPKALLVVIEDEEYWIPQSQIDDDSEVYDDNEHREGTLVISEWIAEKKGL